MNSLLNRLFIALSISLMWGTVTDANDDWRVWRGPNGNGVAAAGQTPPTAWSENANVKWKTKVPGRGHSSPIVVGQKIFLTTADRAKMVQSIVCFDRATGKQLWQTTVNTGNFAPRIHGNNTHASPTIVATSNQLFATFNNNDSVQLACLDFDGNIEWQKNTGPFAPRFAFGYGASPCLYKDNVIVMSDGIKGFMASFNQKNGAEVWRTKRSGSSYASPIITTIGGKEQLFVSGSRTVKSYNPKTGSENWTVPATWQVSCGTMVWDDELVFVSGGFPSGQTLAIKADGSKVVWQNRVKSYEQSLLAYDGYVYAISDKGIAYCWDAKTGSEMWKKRLKDKVSSSPVLAGGNIYFTVENGTTFVAKLNPKKFELVAENKLGDSCFATLTFVDNTILTRVGTHADRGSHQWLYCLENGE